MFTKTVILPVGLDEAFALITEPERLRRWQAVSARVDLRADADPMERLAAFSGRRPVAA